jgi:hypothetical protein
MGGALAEKLKGPFMLNVEQSLYMTVRHLPIAPSIGRP